MSVEPVWYLLALHKLLRFEAVKISTRSALFGVEGKEAQDEAIKKEYNGRREAENG